MWELDGIVPGYYDKNAFLKRVFEHMSRQDQPVGGNPPTYGNLFQGKARDGPIGHLGRRPELKQRGNVFPLVSSVVQGPRKAKEDYHECFNIQTLRPRLKKKYGSTFLSGKPVFSPSVPERYGEAKIRLKPDPCVN